jgi:hypothetical protein
MKSARRAGIILGSLAAAMTLAASAAQPAAPPGWQIVASVHYGPRNYASGYTTAIALTPGNAWAFGGTNPGGTSAPTAEHWDGAHWRAARLPGGLSGFIVGAAAQSPKNIWAVGGGYALHFNGSAWSVAKTFRPAGQATSVAAISTHDVWIFGAPRSGAAGLGAWHYDGRAWGRQGGIAAMVFRASVVSATDIWAITATRFGSLVTYNGRTWVPASAAGRALASTQLDDVLALSASNVWVAGITPPSGSSGRVVLAHGSGKSWARFVAPWPVQRVERFAADGAGGIWIPVVTGGGSPQAWLLHLSRSGQWTRTQVTSSPSTGVGIGDLALVPGTTSLWGAGGLLKTAGGNAAIWSSGPLSQLTAKHSG